MKRFIFTSLINAQLLILIHSNNDNENTYYNEIKNEAFRPITSWREAFGIMDHDMKSHWGLKL